VLNKQPALSDVGRIERDVAHDPGMMPYGSFDNEDTFSLRLHVESLPREEEEGRRPAVFPYFTMIIHIKIVIQLVIKPIRVVCSCNLPTIIRTAP